MKSTRAMRPLLAGLVVIAAASGCTGPARDAPGDAGEQVAAALARAREAEGRPRGEALADALAIIDRSGARPLPGWTGPDPVPGWRARVGGKPGAAPVPLRGTPLGPGYRSGQVPGGRSDSFEQLFLSGRKASVALSAPGNAPLSLRVLDAGRNPVCAAGDGRACRWVPLFTQRYLIEVRNGGSRVADYFLVVD